MAANTGNQGGTNSLEQQAMNTRNKEIIGMMARARRAKTRSNTYRDRGETRQADGNRNTREDEQTVSNTNSTNRDGKPNARTDARVGYQNLQESNLPRQLRICI